MARPCLVPSHCNSARIHDRISAERDVGIRRFTCFTVLLQRSHEQQVCQLVPTTMSISSTNTSSFLILFHYGSPIAPLLDIEFCSTPCPCDGIVNFLPSLTLFRLSPSRSHLTDCSCSGKHIPNSQSGVTVWECRSEYGTQQSVSVSREESEGEMYWCDISAALELSPWVCWPPQRYNILLYMLLCM